MPSQSLTSKHAATRTLDARLVRVPPPRRDACLVGLGAAYAIALAASAIALTASTSARASGPARDQPAMSPEAAHAAVDRMARRSEELFRRYREAKARHDAPRARCLDRVVSMSHAVERRGQDEADAISRAARLADDAALAERSHRLRILIRNGEALKDASDSCG